MHYIYHGGICVLSYLNDGADIFLYDIDRRAWRESRFCTNDMKSPPSVRSILSYPWRKQYVRKNSPKISKTSANGRPEINNDN